MELVHNHQSRINKLVNKSNWVGNTKIWGRLNFPIYSISSHMTKKLSRYIKQSNFAIFWVIPKTSINIAYVSTDRLSYLNKFVHTGICWAIHDQESHVFILYFSRFWASRLHHCCHWQHVTRKEFLYITYSLWFWQEDHPIDLFPLLTGLICVSDLI